MTAITRRLGATAGQAWSLGVGLVVAVVLAVLGLPPVVHHTRTIIRPAQVAAAPRRSATAGPAPAPPQAAAPAAVAPSPIVATPVTEIPPFADATAPTRPPFGTVVAEIPMSSTGGVAVDGAGLAYVAASRSINVLDGGDVVRSFPIDIAANGMALDASTLVAVDVDGRVVTMDTRTGKASPVTAIPNVSPCVLTPGATSCEPGVRDRAPSISGVAVRDGVAYVADAGQGIVWRVVRGRNPAVWASSIAWETGNGPSAIASTADALLVTIPDDLSPQTAGGSSLYRVPVDAKGAAGSPALVATLDRGGKPSGLAVAPDGRIFVAMNLAHALVVLGPDGTQQARISDGPASMPITVGAWSSEVLVTTAGSVVRLAI